MLVDFSDKILKIVDSWGDSVKLSLKNIQSENNESKLYLCVRVPDLSNIVPIVDMDAYYMEYQKGRNFEGIVYEIEDIISDIVEEPLLLVLKASYFKI